jgi:hypothetical protein
LSILNFGLSGLSRLSSLFGLSGQSGKSGFEKPETEKQRDRDSCYVEDDIARRALTAGNG